MLRVRDGFKFGFGMLLAREVWLTIVHYVLYLKRQIKNSQKN